MKEVRFIMIGGFLGAGKTTLLGQLARRFQQQGQKVGVITNDQADNLVDTLSLRAQGFRAEEIPGGCFCCRFDALTEAAGRLTQAERPDVLLAEPVGSCTDLVATVVQPLKRLYADRYTIAPYPVLVDPMRVQKILTGNRLGDPLGDPLCNRGGFSPKVAYIFRKQLEEADAIVVNKADTLDPAGRQVVSDLIGRHFPGKDLLLLSARSGQGVDELSAFLDRQGPFGRSIPEVDYDTYAEGEAELGWLNSTVRIGSSKPFPADDLVLELARAVQQALTETGGEVAHLKMLLRDRAATTPRPAIANLVRGDAQPELSQPSHAECREADLVVNARVHMEPEALEEIVERCLRETGVARGIGLQCTSTQRFKPGRPAPTHRYAEAL